MIDKPISERSVQIIDKQDLTLRELNSLSPIGKLFEDIEPNERTYYKDECGKIYEMSVYINEQSEQVGNRIKSIEKYSEISKIMKGLGF